MRPELASHGSDLNAHRSWEIARTTLEQCSWEHCLNICRACAQLLSHGMLAGGQVGDHCSSICFVTLDARCGSFMFSICCAFFRGSTECRKKGWCAVRRQLWEADSGQILRDPPLRPIRAHGGTHVGVGRDRLQFHRPTPTSGRPRRRRHPKSGAPPICPKPPAAWPKAAHLLVESTPDFGRTRPSSVGTSSMFDVGCSAL